MELEGSLVPICNELSMPIRNFTDSLFLGGQKQYKLPWVIRLTMPKSSHIFEVSFSEPQKVKWKPASLSDVILGDILVI